MKIISEVVFGSKLYGTDTKNSDTDFIGVYLPSKEDILLGKVQDVIDFSTSGKDCSNTPDDVDRKFFSLNFFIRLLQMGDTSAMDMLHAPADKTVMTSPIWDFLVANRSKFYSKNIAGLLLHVKNQGNKYGLLNHRVKKLSELLDILNGLNDEQLSDRLDTIFDKLPIHEGFSWISTDERQRIGHQEFYHTHDRKYQCSIPIYRFKEAIEEIWGKYSNRSRKVFSDGGVNWKDLSHAFRVGYQLLDIYRKGGYSYPAPERQWLMDVKAGNIPLDTALEELGSLLELLEVSAAKSDYPETVDFDFCMLYVIECYTKVVTGEV